MFAAAYRMQRIYEARSFVHSSVCTETARGRRGGGAAAPRARRRVARLALRHLPRPQPYCTSCALLCAPAQKKDRKTNSWRKDSGGASGGAGSNVLMIGISDRRAQCTHHCARSLQGGAVPRTWSSMCTRLKLLLHAGRPFACLTPPAPRPPPPTRSSPSPTRTRGHCHSDR